MKSSLLAALLASTSFLAAPTVFAQPAAPALTVVAESPEMIWNAVAVDRGRIFVAGPRWTGSKGPALAFIDGRGRPQPYPDDKWNGWRPGAETVNAFVNINAIHLDRSGNLWVIDTGCPDFGGDPLPGAAKLVKIDLSTNRVVRAYPLGPGIAKHGSYVDDIRIKGDIGYLTDAGRPGLIVLNTVTGEARRVLDDHSSTTAPTNRPIILDGAVLKAPDGSPLRVHSDPLELSPDGAWLYFGPLTGPWSRIETRWLDDPSLSPAELAAKVEAWADIPPVGGTAMAASGDFYFTDLAEDALKRRAPDGTVTTIIRDPRLHWVDAPFIDEAGAMWLPVPQMDRVALFNAGTPKTRWPIQLFRIDLGLKP
ncbi:L-dopachrome tautomerase-related protein [Aquabacter sp. CN5-332]|uniref:L-dopachrome tautomerase-related protein n=1 Tax=Aquabacter sp. CN5-332 TaxID=3156608 RepID=UPI0032B61F52